MGLLNYTTSVPAEKTVSEIQSALAKAGARSVLHEYDGFGHVAAISFRIQTQFGEIAFRLPANIEAVQRILKKQALTGKIRRRYADDIEQATRTAWRILKDWLTAQLALIETGMATVEQVFLPYAQNASGQTVYEALLDRKFAGLTLPEPKDSKVVRMEAGA
jgi:hypothetical protein